MGGRAAWPPVRLLAGKISNTMFSGSDELYDVDGAKVQPKVMMCTRLAARPAADGAAGFSGFCICFMVPVFDLNNGGFIYL